MRNAFIETLTDRAVDEDSIYVISGDAGFGVFETYAQKRPDRFINAGIAEANTIGFAAGLALAGFSVFVYNIVPFVLFRCYEQVRNDICYQRLPVTLIGIGAGLTYAPGGMTHYSIEDLALCLALPNLTVISPVDAVETRAAVNYAVTAREPVYIRIGKSGEPVMKEKRGNGILSPEVIHEGHDVALVTHGSVAAEAMNAARELAKEGIALKIISMPTVQPLDTGTLLGQLDAIKTVLVLEEHFKQGGLYTRLLDSFQDLDVDKHLVPMAIPNKFVHDIRNQIGMRELFQIDAYAVVRRVKDLIPLDAAHPIRKAVQ